LANSSAENFSPGWAETRLELVKRASRIARRPAIMTTNARYSAEKILEEIVDQHSTDPTDLSAWRGMELASL
jgi:hypothetical protein